MTFTATTQPSNIPPRVRLDINTDAAGSSFTALSIKRDGKTLREQPFVGSQSALLFDYEAPFGVPVTYSAEGSYLAAAVADWTETWASLASWTGDTGSFSVSGGNARSTVTAAQIVRSASGTIQRLSVTNPSYVRLELLNAANAVVVSVSVDANIIASGTSSASTSGSGTFTAVLSATTMTVTGAGGVWSVAVPYTGTPVKVRVVSLGISYPAGLSFSTTGTPYAIAVDSSGNTYVADIGNTRIRKYNTSGTQTLSFSTTGTPYGVAVDGSGNIYVADNTNNLIRKYNTSGTQTLSFATTGQPYAIALDASANIYVLDLTNNLVRKYNSSGTQTLSFSIAGTGTNYGLAVDGSGNIYVLDGAGKFVRKYNSSGTLTLTYTTTSEAYSFAVDSAGVAFVGDALNNQIRKFTAAGVQSATWSTVGSPYGVAVQSTGDVHVVDQPNKIIRKFTATTPTVGSISPTLVAAVQPFSATVTATLAVTQAWLIHPSQPSLSQPIDSGLNSDDSLNYIEASSGEQKSSRAQSTVHHPIGRRRPVVITSGPRQADEWTLVLGAPTIAQKNALRSLVDDQSPLLLRVPPTAGYDLPDDWYSVGDFAVNRVEVPVITQQTIVTLPLTPVDEPIVRVGALWTYGSDLIVNATYAASLAKFPTYLDRLAGAS